MKNILVIGVGRAGKTTLSNMIKNKYNQYNIVHSDSVKWSIIRAYGKEEYYRQNIDKQKEFEHGEEFQKILVELYKSCVRNDKEQYGYILETGQLQPKYAKEIIDACNAFCICLGHGQLDTNGIIDLCKNNDKETDWSYNMPIEKLEVHANKWNETNQLLKEQCKQYGIEYIDTSKNRDEILNRILEKIDFIINNEKDRLV